VNLKAEGIRKKMNKITVAARFAGYFNGRYDGSYDTRDAEQPRADFIRLTDFHIMWAQVHGQFKDAVKRELFTPYPHWTELHECCGRIVRQYASDGMYWEGPVTGARIMNDGMRLLKSVYGFNAPRWWIPLIRQMRGEEVSQPKQPWRASV
jgi:hypothetical protein